MKKFLLLSCCLMLSYAYCKAQPVFYVESPSSISGLYNFSWAEPPNWGTADLNDCLNAVRDTLMLVDDGSLADSLGCNPLINDLTGKIAVVYRFTCEFGAKAKNAQDAGAVGVIIINHSPGLINMGAGAQGANVTIPTVIISNTDGAKLRAAMDAGDVVVFIGSKCYANDLGFYAADILIPRASANPALVSSSATEFNVPMGGWIHNYGTAAQTGITLTAVISGAATYSATSSPAISTLAPGDSAYVSIPAYSAASYSGLYHINYTINYAAADSFPADNKFYANFLIDSLASYVFIDTVTQLPVSTDYYRATGTGGTYITEYQTCIHFKDANASRLRAMGIYASAATDQRYGEVLNDVVLDAKLYEWNDVFTGLSDANFPASPWTLNEVSAGSYTYPSDQQGKLVYLPFNPYVTLKDNQRYLFCAVSYGTGTDTIQLGFNTYYDYFEVIDTANGFDQPVSIVMADGDQYALGFGSDATSSVSVLFGGPGAGVGENNMSFHVTPYPNPTSDFIKIPFKGMTGTAQLNIIDMNGKMVNAQTVRVAGTVVVNVKDVPSGNYVFSMLFENGKNTTFNVVISK